MTALPAGRVSAAALLALPWCLLLAVLAVLQPPTAANWAAADPILGFLPQALYLWGVPLFGVAVAGAWLRFSRPDAADLRWSLARAAAGVVSAGLIVGTIRWLAGPVPPPFIPTEESTAPGLLLGLSAGVGEEFLFRMTLVPLLFWALKRRLPKLPASVLTALVTGVLFSLLHALGPGDPPVMWHLSRLLLPGMLMTFAYLRLGPAFLLTAHFAAHLWIPLLFD